MKRCIIKNCPITASNVPSTHGDASFMKVSVDTVAREKIEAEYITHWSMNVRPRFIQNLLNNTIFIICCLGKRYLPSVTPDAIFDVNFVRHGHFHNLVLKKYRCKSFPP